MSKPALENLRDLTDGIVYGRLMDAGVPPQQAGKIATRIGNFAASEVRQEVPVK